MPVYLLCFNRPISDKHASHYLGYADRDTERRIAQHRRGRAGAAFTTEAYRQGIPFVVANVWPDLGKEDERRIKQSKNHARYCRVCSGREWTMPRPRRVRHARKSTLEAPIGENIAETGMGRIRIHGAL